MWGGEASVDVEASPWLRLSAAGEIVRGTNEALDGPLPLIPPRRARLGAEVHGGPTGLDHAFAGVEGEIVAAPDRLNPFDIPVEGYALLNIASGVEGEWAGRDIRLDVSVRNALDAEYRDFLSRYKAFALNPGRDIAVRLRTAF